jgi:hypothetical protein
MSDQPTSLYGNQPPAPKLEAPGLMEQIVGVFTSPVELYQRLNKTPSWAWALGILTLGVFILTIIWGLKVDVDEMVRPVLERNPQVQASQIDMMVALQKKILLPIGAIAALFGTAVVMALVALIYFLVGKVSHEGEAPSYPQALSAAVVPGLVKLPQLLLLIIICLLRPVGGLTPDKLGPTSLGYFLHTESFKLQALYYSVDLFYLAEAVLSYLALRHLVRMKTAGALLCILLPMVLGIGFRVLGAK